PDDRGAAVPPQDVPALAEHPGRARLQLVEQTLQRRTDARGCGRAVPRAVPMVAGQREEMGRLLRLEAERGGDVLQYRPGWAHVARLLQPRVPLGADPGERRDLLAPEAGGSPSRAAG